MKTASDLWKTIEKKDLFGVRKERRNCLNVILNFLRNNIPRKNYVKHQNNDFLALWEKIGKEFETRNRIHEAMAIFESLHHELTATQIEENCYIPKGMPLVWMRDYCFKFLKQPWLAQRYILLTIIEDAIPHQGKINPNVVGSYFRAVWFQNIKDAIFREFAQKAYNLYRKDRDMGRFPEWILLNLMDIDIFSVKYPSTEEIEIFPLNIPFAKYWYKNISSESKKKGTPFEDFCAYLLSCMPGFEVRRRVRTGDYHFDALIRNKANATDFLADFGNYIISESKNWSNPLGPQEIAYFASKMLFHDIRSGIIFSQKGISGKEGKKNATLTAIKSFYKVGRIIMIITEEDLKKLIAKESLINILQSKYENSRFA